MDHIGVLVAKKKLFKNKVPNGSGGGAVFFVSRKDHRYLKVNIVELSCICIIGGHLKGISPLNILPKLNCMYIYISCK